MRDATQDDATPPPRAAEDRDAGALGVVLRAVALAAVALGAGAVAGLAFHAPGPGEAAAAVAPR